ncbi:MAG: peptide ABC transporter substrate-binding protein [Erysipelotrichaceae bacterium]|nr:peptide ABC transporter substrate-binding protein [Erysipelotrichaceae bacterium]
MKRLLTVLLSVLMLVSLAACSGKPEEKPADEKFVVTAVVASEPETIDPTMISSVDGNTYVNHLFEPLMHYATNGKAVGDDPKMNGTDLTYGQAKSMDVSTNDAGQTVYTFTLRDDIFWSDGEPVTAKDFEYSWKRVMNPEMAADYGYLLPDLGIVGGAEAYYEGGDPANIKATALDDKTFEVVMENELPFFDQLAAFGNLVPLRQDIIEKYGDTWTEPGNMVSNGPYVLTEWVHDSYILMEKNDKYYNPDVVGPDQLKFYLTDDENAILASYQSGEFDFIESFPSDMIPSLKASGDYYALPAVTTYYLYLNTDHLTDWRVRAAIALCIDRDNIVGNVTQGGQIPAYSLVTGGITDSTGALWQNGTGYDEAVLYSMKERYPEYDLSTYAGRCEAAKALLAEAVADGFDTSVTIPYRFNNLGTHGQIAEAVQQDVVNVLGLNMTMDSTEWQVYTSTLSTNREWCVARLGWQADYLDASSFIDLFRTDGPYNFGKWSNPDFDALCVEYTAMKGGAERDAKMLEAEKLMFAEGGFPVSPIYYYTNAYCLSNKLSGVCASTLGFYLFTYATQAN